LAALALVLRLYGLSDKPLWYDEIVTLNRANLPLAELVIDALKHKHFPTYFLLLGPFASADIDAWMLRFPSAVFGAVCVLLVSRLAAEIRGPRTGLGAGLLMALSPFEVQFGQEARSYTLTSCLVLVAIWGLVRIANRPEAAALPVSRPEALRGAWVTYTLGTIGALLVLNIAIPWLLVSNLAMLAIVRHAACERRGLLHNWALAQVVILLLWVPALIAMWLANRGAVLSGLEWVSKTTWENIWSIVAAVYLFRISDLMTFVLLPTPLPGFGAGVVMFALFGAWRLKTDPAMLAVIGLAFLAMPIAILVMSAFQPMLVPRYLMWSTGPFFVLAGIGAAALPARFFPLIAVAITVGGTVSLAPYYSSETKPRWDRAAAYLVNNARPQDVIIAQNQAAKFVLASYANRFQLDSKIPIVAWNNLHDTARRVEEGERAWAVYGRYGQETQEPEEGFRQKWSGFGIPGEQVRFGSHILILRFDNSALGTQRTSDRRSTGAGRRHYPRLSFYTPNP
jgi:4-amino-4-deoxy-L-arabinose transferase-like glycosyltransferase